MQLKNTSLLFSPTDLTLFTSNPFISWMDRYVIELPDTSPARDDPDPMMESLKEKGFEHENRIISNFEQQGLTVVRISSSDKQADTLNALQSGVDVIIQAYLSTVPFAGYAGFLIREDGNSSLGGYRYRVADAKLSKTPSPEYLIQLCCYADLLADIQGVLPSEIGLYVGDQSYRSYATEDYFSYYLALKSQFLDFHQKFDKHEMPDPTLNANTGHWSAYAKSLVEQQDHLSQVATITRRQVKCLRDANVHTMSGLAKLDGDRIPSIQEGKLAWLISRANLQVASKGKLEPDFQVLESVLEPPTGLALLDKHSPFDVYFDIEGNPLHEDGLEYLWGSTYFDEQGGRQFKIEMIQAKSRHDIRCIREQAGL